MNSKDNGIKGYWDVGMFVVADDRIIHFRMVSVHHMRLPEFRPYFTNNNKGDSIRKRLFVIVLFEQVFPLHHGCGEKQCNVFLLYG
jgi:hypothetical protein